MKDRKIDIQKQTNCSDLNDYVLTEEDFYPAPDNRMHFCGIDDIPYGDNYFEFAEEFYELYGEDLFG